MLDDLIRLGRGDQIPADAVVVSGECHVNESLLTGESDAIHKRPGDELMSGSFIDAGLVYARVIHVGADNYVARINNEAKYVKKVNSEIMNALNAIVRFASVFMVPIGLALFYSSVHNSYQSWCALDPN
ncbi:MAG: haloacid dehalogenase, partial [Collinsella intestinalis]